MNKTLIIICLGLIIFSCIQTYKCNSNEIMKQVEDDLLLNKTEGRYLNRIFETTRNDFDFVNKKIGFLTGSSGTKKSSKEFYFDMHDKHFTNPNLPCDNGIIYIFNAEQKVESGGYDAAIVYWSKVVVPIDKVIKLLKDKR